MADPDHGTQHPDDDPTDELPVLSDIAILELETRAAEQSVGTDEETAVRPRATPAAASGNGRALPDPTIGSLERHVAELSERWQHLEHQLERHSTALAALNEQLADTQRALNRSTAAERQLSERLEERDAELDRLREAAAATERDREALRLSHESLQRQHETLQQAHEALRAQHDALRERHDAAVSERDAALEEREGMARERAEAGEDAQRLRQERDAARARQAELETQVEETAEQLRQLQAAREADAGRAADPGSERAYRSELAALSHYIENRRRRWEDLEAEVAAQRQRIVELEAEVEQRVERQQDAENTARLESERAAELKAELAETARQLEAERRRTRRAGDAGERVSEVETELTEARAALEAQRAELERLRRAAGAGSAPAPTGSPGEERAGGTATPSLVCLTSDQPRHYDIVKPVMSIGRSASADIQVLTHFVSRDHARLVLEDEGVAIEDLGSTNGVFVNSVRVQRRLLGHGDWITIGESQFRYLSGTGR